MKPEGVLHDGVRTALTSVGFVPMASKLYRPMPGIVARSSLLERVRCAGADVVTVTAPAGYGKSTFAAELVADDPRQSAWISLTRDENDPPTILSYVALALDELEPVNPSCVEALWKGGATVGSEAVQRFGALFAARREPFVLVLDDVHELTSQDALDAMQLLVNELPRGSTLVFASRRVVPLGWGRFRARRRLVEVGAEDLAFRDDEAALLFERLDVSVTDADRSRLLERTEGWPVAIYLAALAHGNGREPVTELAGDHRYLVEYLGEELLDELDAEVASFLLEASSFDRMSGTLCDEVLDRLGSARLLETLQRDNRLVIPLDDHRGWYRFHHLLTEFLQAELTQRDPRRKAAIHLRASGWYDDHGEPDGAVAQAALAGDWDCAEAMVMRWLNPVGSGAESFRMGRWVSLFPAEELAARPQLMAVATWSVWFAGAPKSVVHWLDRMAAAIPDHHPDHPASLAPVWLAHCRASMGPLGPREMQSEASYVYEHMDPASWHPMPCLGLGAAAFMLGDEMEAVRWLSEGAATTLDRPLPVAYNLAHLAIIDIEHERWAQARALASRARVLIEGAIDTPPAVVPLAVHVLVETQAGHGEEVVREHQRCRQQLTGLIDITPWMNLQARIALARTALIRGDRAEAAALLAEVEAILATMPEAVRVAEQARSLRRELAHRDRSQGFGPSSLSTAELRVLQLLPTHLTVPEVAQRLHVARNTVRTQIASIYRKLGVTSRSDAVKAAGAAGLLSFAVEHAHATDPDP
jgi:LuxR family maltose regulon positive regulatory protein